MTSKVLTAATVKSAVANPSKRREIADKALPGLYLIVQPSGSKSWALRYRVAGAPKKLTIGTALTERLEPIDGPPALGAPMTLVEARGAARAALQAIAEGRDPAEQKKAARAVANVPADPEKDLVRTHATAFIDRHCKPRNRSWPEVERQFKSDILPAIGDRRVQDIRKRDLIEMMDAIVDRGAPIVANRVLATLRKFFGWLVDRDVIEASPAGGVAMPSRETSRDRVLTDDELRLFWKATAKLGQPFGPLFRLLLITGQRRDEVGGMNRQELALDGEPVWTIPRARAKNDVEHAVPLSPLAVETIAGVAQIGRKGLVFTTNGETHVSGYSRAKDRLDSLMIEISRAEAAERGDDPEKVEAPTRWTLHDLRRTVATRMAGLNINLPVIEKVLNHVSGSFAGIVAVYQRHEFKDEKRRALNAWADHLLTLVAHKSTENIIRLRAAT